MLAGLLCNLSSDAPPPPPPPAVAPQFFGGGPFSKRYGYDPRSYRQDDEEERAREIREELPEPQREVVESAIERAVQAIKREELKPVIDAEKLYRRVLKKADVGREIQSLWRAEIARRIREEEDEMIPILLGAL